MTDNQWKGVIKDWRKEYRYGYYSITAHIEYRDGMTYSPYTYWFVSVSVSIPSGKTGVPNISMSSTDNYEDIDVAKAKAEVMVKGIITALNAWNGYLKTESGE